MANWPVDTFASNSSCKSSAKSSDSELSPVSTVEKSDDEELELFCIFRDLPVFFQFSDIGYIKNRIKI